MVDVGAGMAVCWRNSQRSDLICNCWELIFGKARGLAAQVDWAQDLWDVRYGCWTSGEAGAALAQPEPVMIICCEWLDDLPCPVVAQHADGWREVIINDDGKNRLGRDWRVSSCVGRPVVAGR